MTLAILAFILPIFFIVISKHVSIVDRIGIVPLAFLGGIILALFIENGGNKDLVTTVNEASVALALPLILFSSNVFKTIKTAGSALTAMMLALLSVVIVSIAGSVLFSSSVESIPDVAALAVGAYSGSNMNMGAIATALDTDKNLLGTIIGYDIIFSVCYMLFVFFVGQRFSGLFLRAYSAKATSENQDDQSFLTDESASAYHSILARGNIIGGLIVLVGAILSVAAAVILSGFLPEAYASTGTILLITTFGIIGSLFKFINRNHTSYNIGMYFMLVFLVSIGMLFDLSIFTNMNWNLAGFFLFVIFGSMILQLILCHLCGIDRDTYLIASSAAIMSVPFIPAIAGALKNRALIVPGIAIAIVGYALGNYLGIFVAKIITTLIG